MTRRSPATQPPTLAACIVCIACSVASCRVDREAAREEPAYEAEVEALLDTHCAECHGAQAPAAGYAVSPYLAATGCGDVGVSVVGADDAGVPLLRALSREDHATLLDDDGRARLSRWVDGGAPLRTGGVHGGDILDPRAPGWHGTLAAAQRYGPLLDPAHPAACGACHAGAPATPPGVSAAVAAATPCTDCHGAAQGVLACGTCHGDGGDRPYPPRDACLFPDAAPDAHAAHVRSGEVLAAGLACAACHPGAGPRLQGRHGDGTVDVTLRTALAGPDARFDPATGSCDVACHARGGARPRPRFSEVDARLGCGDCHGAPPADHYAGSCDACHPGVNAAGDALEGLEHHLDGVVDVFGGVDGDCSGCHGVDGDPMPRTGAHTLHASTRLTTAIDCDACHEVPAALDAAGHLDRGAPTPADVRFGARAEARQRAPSYTDGRCAEIACHGAGLDGGDRVLPWEPTGGGSCAGCHGLPPGGDHPRDTSCAAGLCHGAEVSAGTPRAITEMGRSRHIDGVIDVEGR